MGFEWKHVRQEQITMAVRHGAQRPIYQKDRQDAGHADGVNVTHVTVYNWVAQYGKMMDKYMDTITPQVGNQWRTDEVFLKIRGERKYLFSMLDADTRFWLAKMVAVNKGIDDVAPMFKDAKRLAGKVPEELISDGANNFARAHHTAVPTQEFHASALRTHLGTSTWPAT